MPLRSSRIETLVLALLLVTFGVVGLDRLLSWTTEHRTSWFPYGQYLSSTVLVFCGVTFVGLICLRFWSRRAMPVVVLLMAAGAVLLELSQAIDADRGTGVDAHDLVLTVLSSGLAGCVLWWIARGSR